MNSEPEFKDRVYHWRQLDSRQSKYSKYLQDVGAHHYKTTLGSVLADFNKGRPPSDGGHYFYWILRFGPSVQFALEKIEPNEGWRRDSNKKGFVGPYCHPMAHLRAALTRKGPWEQSVVLRRSQDDMPLTVEEIELVGQALHIPASFWYQILGQNTRHRLGQAEQSGGPQSILESDLFDAQDRCLRIFENYCFVPDNSVSSHQVAAFIFLADSFSDAGLCAMAPPDFNTYVDPSAVTWKGGMISCIVAQAIRMSDASAKDLTAICIEVLLRTHIASLKRSLGTWGIHSLNVPGELLLGLETTWLRLRMALSACQDTLKRLPAWADYHLDGDSKAHVRSALTWYEANAGSLELLLDVQRHRIDLMFARQSAQMAAASIQESKNTKLLTIIAFVYLPVSISASIFGMNVQQLNDSGVDIYWFGVAIIVTMVALLACWLIFAVLANLRRRVEGQHFTRQAGPSDDRSFWARLFWVDVTWQRISAWSEGFVEHSIKN